MGALAQDRGGPIRTSLDGTGVIVVGVDGSDAARAALRWAARLGVMTGTPVHAVMAWSDIDLDDDPSVVLSAAVTAAADGAAVTPVVEHGVAVDALLAHSAEAAVLVLGRRPGPLPVGTVAQECLRRAACPVLLVPE